MPASDSRSDEPPVATHSRSDGRSRVLWAVQVAVVLFGLWLLLSGPQAWPVGLAAALSGAVIGAWLVPGETHPWRPLQLLRFLVYFLKESVLGGIDVAQRALRPSVDIAPCFARYRLGLPPGPPRTLMVSVTSLLPGTLSVDLDSGSGELLVHALAEEALASVAELEAHVARLFGLPLVPAEAGRVDTRDDA